MEPYYAPLVGSALGWVASLRCFVLRFVFVSAEVAI